MRDRIIKYIKDLEEYPMMHDLVSTFIRTHYDGSIDVEHNVDFLKSLLELCGEGKIFYDSKHDSWLYTGADTPKLKKMIRESIKL